MAALSLTKDLKGWELRTVDTTFPLSEGGAGGRGFGGFGKFFFFGGVWFGFGGFGDVLGFGLDEVDVSLVRFFEAL